MTVIVLLGAPGAGKGTQAQKLAERFDLSHVSTGDILREAVREGTSVGKRVRAIMEAGELVPDQLVSEVIRQRLTGEAQRQVNGLILDGYPRTVAQAQCLAATCERARVTAVNLEVEQGQLLKRLCGRRSCPNCGRIYNVYLSPPQEEGLCDHCGTELIQRQDDREQVVSQRLKVYREQTAPVIDFYRAQGIYLAVDGSRDVDAVFEDLTKRLGAWGLTSRV